MDKGWRGVHGKAKGPVRKFLQQSRWAALTGWLEEGSQRTWERDAATGEGEKV